ncbi:hypothetical protein DFH06DRAFT_1128046 [Mycena polygramma]|nr:hypothetical protein DFH06DRAFT_1128046 [Mycena polygramma]
MPGYASKCGSTGFFVKPSHKIYWNGVHTQNACLSGLSSRGWNPQQVQDASRALGAPSKYLPIFGGGGSSRVVDRGHDPRSEDLLGPRQNADHLSSLQKFGDLTHSLAPEFYDTEKFVFPLALKDPQTFTIFETLAIGEFLISNTATPFLFKNNVPQIPIVNPAPPLPQTNVGLLGPQATDGIPSPPKPPTDSGSRSRSTTPSPSTKSRSTTPAPSITPSRSGSPPPKQLFQDVPLPEPELSTPPPPPRPKRGGKAGTKRAREASNPDDPDQEDGRRKKRKAPIRIREGQDNDVANTRRRSTRQSAGAIGTDVRNAQKKIATKPGKPRYKGWVEVLSENSSDEN